MRGCLAFVFMVLCLLLLAAFLFGAPMARSAAKAWIINDPLQKADLIVVPGGGLESRPFAAATLYQKGFAPKILLMSPVSTPTDELGLTRPEAEISRQVLLRMHVPNYAILTAARQVSTTHDEAVTVGEWASTNGVKRVIIPTDLFHTRRLRWIFNKELKPRGIEVCVEAVPRPRYTADDWWQHEEGLIEFQNELIKSLYYHLKY
jgi:uncharacterized SAM-binding protein YcdF (DUF218 family)